MNKATSITMNSPDCPAELKPFRTGSKDGEERIAKNVEFRSNDILDAKIRRTGYRAELQLSVTGHYV
jgi:hypothetical protein